MQLERKELPFELKATAGDGSTFDGYAACFHNVDSYGDIIAKGAFADGLAAFLSDGLICWQHDWHMPIGKPTKAVEDDRGLFAGGKISDTTDGRDAKTLLKDGVVKKLSIGFRTLGRTWLETPEEVMAYWKTAGYTPTSEDVAASVYGARLLTKIKLYEFSPVSVPANSSCDITRVKRPSGTLGSRLHGDEGGAGASGPAGLTFADHSEVALAAVEEFCERAMSLSQKRALDGRDLSPERRSQIRRLYESLGGLLNVAKDEAGRGADPDPAPAAADPLGTEAFIRYQLTRAGLNGVAIRAE